MPLAEMGLTDTRTLFRPVSCELVKLLLPDADAVAALRVEGAPELAQPLLHARSAIVCDSAQSWPR